MTYEQGYIWIYANRRTGNLWLMKRPRRYLRYPLWLARSYDTLGRSLPLHGFTYRSLAKFFVYIGKL